MNIFKITGPQRGKTIIIPADDKEDLIHSACIRLSLPLDKTYQIVLENDGSLIEEYGVMAAIASRADLIKFMLLPEGTEWTTPNSVPGANNGHSSVESENSAISNLNANQNNSGFQAPQSTIEDRSHSVPIVLADIIPKGFANSSGNCSTLVTKLIHQAAEYTQTAFESNKYAGSLKVATQIVWKYPKAFEKILWKDGKVYSDGILELRATIYDRLKYEEKLSKKRGHNDIGEPTVENAKKRGKTNTAATATTSTTTAAATEDNPNKKGKTKSTRSSEDEWYGCPGYEPPLADNETLETQKEKKILLLTYFEEGCDTPMVTNLMDQTYPSQRKILNNRDDEELTLQELLTNYWPYLTKEKHFIDHANTLLGKKVQDIWNLNLEGKSKAIVTYFEGMSFENSKTNPAPGNMTKKDKINEVLKTCKQVEKEVESQKPPLIAIFPLLALEFKERELLILKDSVATEEQIKNAAIDSAYPALIVAGSSIYDEECTCYIVIEKQIVLTTNDVLKGVLLLLLSYYVYAYKYPPAQFASFNFIQRVLLDVNPEGKGRKKMSKKMGTLLSKVLNHVV